MQELTRRPVAFTRAREHPAGLGETLIGLALGPGRSSGGSGGLLLGGPICAGTDAAEHEPEHLPPAVAKSRVRTKAGMGGGSNTVPAGGGTTAGDDGCAASMSFLTHKAMSRLTISHNTACASGTDSIL